MFKFLFLNYDNLLAIHSYLNIKDYILRLDESNYDDDEFNFHDFDESRGIKSNAVDKLGDSNKVKS